MAHLYQTSQEAGQRKLALCAKKQTTNPNVGRSVHALDLTNWGPCANHRVGKVQRPSVLTLSLVGRHLQPNYCQSCPPVLLYRGEGTPKF